MPAPRTLILPLKRHWFEAIKAGTKPLEFRLYNDYWRRRLEGQHYDRVRFMLGYPKADQPDRILECDYHGYDITEVTSPEWNNIPQKVFAIKTPCHP